MVLMLNMLKMSSFAFLADKVILRVLAAHKVVSAICDLGQPHAVIYAACVLLLVLDYTDLLPFPDRGRPGWRWEARASLPPRLLGS